MSSEICPEKHYSIWRLLAPAIAMMATLVFASAFARVSPVGLIFFQFDKIAHFFVFGLLGTLFFRALRIDNLDKKRWIIAFLLVMAFGVLDEILQFFNPNRSFDPYDWLADGTGPLLAIFLYRNWRWYRNLLETRIFGSSRGR